MHAHALAGRPRTSAMSQKKARSAAFVADLSDAHWYTAALPIYRCNAAARHPSQ